MSADERRRHVRIPADLAVAIAYGSREPMTGKLVNFSEEGVFLSIPANVMLERKVHLHFILKPDHTVCEASGKVAWRGPNGVGIYFDEVNAHYRNYVQELKTAANAATDRQLRQAFERMLGEPSVEIS